jgi:hexosaminidase
MPETPRMQDPQPDATLMPLPRVLQWTAGAPLPAGTTIVPRFAGVTSPRIEDAAAQFLAAWANVPRTGVPPGAPTDLVIDCTSASPALPALGDDERYRLEVVGDLWERLPGRDSTDPRSRRITLAAPQEWGVIRGLATLTQLALGTGALAPVTIEDAPRFPWRGLMLDVARHFLSPAKLVATLDAMALFKLNVLHLHLSDDQAFRFPSRTYPRLASGQSYRQDELEALVRHAAGLGIRVVPELDMPGHVTSWLTAYPEWGCEPCEPSTRFGVHAACLDPTSRAVDTAIGTLLSELAEVFPDAYLHIGGDEVNPGWWNASAAVQAYMAEHGLAGAADMQADFNRRAVARVTALGRRTLAWDEVLHSTLPGRVTVQTWRGATARDRALAAGHDCVVSANYYVDLFLPADVHYGFDPEAAEATLIAREDALEADPRIAHVAAGLRWTRHWREVAPVAPATDRDRGRVLGGEACLWAELVDETTLDVRLWSRLPALAERFWSSASVTDPADMRRRLRGSLRALAARGTDIQAASRALIAAAGVTPPWHALVDYLEPVKWYARLLGAEALAARLAGREMPLARPYRTDTPLDRVADGLPPEAVAAWDLAALCERVAVGDAIARAELRRLAKQWRALPPAGAGPAELEPLAARLAEIGAAVVDLLDGRRTPAAVREILATAAAPVGEYLLAVVPPLAAWLANDRTARAS